MVAGLFSIAQFIDATRRLRHLRPAITMSKGVGMRSLKYCFAIIALIASPALCNAQSRPAYTADDIVKTFKDQPLGTARGLGGQRAVCVGTEADCRKAQAAPPVAETMQPSFDLMIQFALDSDRLTDGARRNLDEFAAALADPRLRDRAFAVEGHTDARGSDDHNFDLSRRRAEAVVRYLEARGVTRDRIQPQAFGSSRPRAADPLDGSNRRVETRIAR